MRTRVAGTIPVGMDAQVPRRPGMAGSGPPPPSTDNKIATKGALLSVTRWQG